MTSLRPGQIQRHGALLAVDDHDLAIVAASENVEAILGAARVVGGGLAAAIASPNERTLRDLIAGELENVNPVDVRTHDGRVLDAMLHRAHGLVIIELEPATSRVPLGRVAHALARVHGAHDVVAAALMEIKALTGMATVELRAEPRATCFIADRAAPSVLLVGSPQLDGRTHEIAGVQLGAYDTIGTGAMLVLDAGDQIVVCEHPEPLHVEVTARLAAQIIAHAIPMRIEVHARSGEGALAGAKILVVEDEHTQAEILAQLLEDSGAITLVAHCASDGLAAIAAFHPDAVISDIVLPDGDGFAFMRRVRALGPNDGGWVPAIAVTGHVLPDYGRDAILAGFQLHMSKPIEPPDLVAQLVRLVGRTARRT